MADSLFGVPPDARGPMPEEMANHLFVVHENIQKSMKDVYHALWPKVERVPEDMAVLAK
jgi:hypothetical protein